MLVEATEKQTQICFDALQIATIGKPFLRPARDLPFSRSIKQWPLSFSHPLLANQLLSELRVGT
jgi:hypothetical protein